MTDSTQQVVGLIPVAIASGVAIKVAKYPSGHKKIPNTPRGIKTTRKKRINTHRGIKRKRPSKKRARKRLKKLT